MPDTNPLNGVKSCSFFDAFERTCATTCLADHFLSVPSPRFFTCGPLGSFNVWNMRNEFQLPSCARKNNWCLRPAILGFQFNMQQLKCGKKDRDFDSCTLFDEYRYSMLISTCLCSYPLAVTSARQSITINVTYEGIQACDQILQVGAFKNNILNWLNALNLMWGTTASNPTGGFCSEPDCASSVQIDVSCDVSVARRRKRATGDVTVAITFMDIL